MTSGPSGDFTADTAGVPWTGRDLSPQPFAGDTGEVDPALAEVLARYGRGEAGLAAVVTVLAAGRVLVPVTAVLGEDHPLPTGLRGDLGADMAVALLTDATGRRALPVFSGVSPLTAWDPAARPVPASCGRAAAAAVAEDCSALVLDPAGPVRVVVPRAAVRAIAAGRAWVPPGADPELAARLRAALGVVPEVLGVRIVPVGDDGVRIVLGVRAGLRQHELDAVTGAVPRLLAQVTALAERADVVQVQVLPA